MTIYLLLFTLVVSQVSSLSLDNGVTFYTPYDLPRIVPPNFNWNVSGEISFNCEEDARDKICIIVTNDIVDTTTIAYEDRGAIAVIFSMIFVNNTIPGRRVAEFQNTGTFRIPAAEIEYNDVEYLRSLNETLYGTLNFQENSWTKIFQSGAFISYKIVRGAVSFGVIVLSILLLLRVKNFERQRIRINTIVASFTLFASIMFLSSCIDQYGQDQIFPSKVAILFFNFGNALVDTSVWLYILIMYEILRSRLGKTIDLVHRDWPYIMIATIELSIEVCFVCLSIAIDSTERSLNILQLIGYIVRMCLRVSMGIFYITLTVRLQSRITKRHPDPKDPIRVKTKYTLLFNWIIGTTSVVRGAFTCFVVIMLTTPLLYTIFFWIEMCLTSVVITSLILSPFINSYREADVKERIQLHHVNTYRTSGIIQP